MTDALLSVRNLTKHFKPAGFARGAVVRALEDVSFDVPRGKVVGLVGESGSGKTTIGRSVLRLIEPTSGEVRFNGVDLTKLSAAEMRPQRRHMQYIFQDPFASLSPRMTIGQILTEGLEIQRIGTRPERAQRARAALAAVDLPADAFDRYAHEFSGGQRQRIGIARALTLEPQLIVADEAMLAAKIALVREIDRCRGHRDERDSAQAESRMRIYFSERRAMTRLLQQPAPMPQSAARICRPALVPAA